MAFGSMENTDSTENFVTTLNRYGARARRSRRLTGRTDNQRPQLAVRQPTDHGCSH